MISERRIIRDALLIVASVLMMAVAAPALARTHHGGIPAAVAAPILQNVSDNFGNLTPAFLGSVRLSSQDLNYGTALNPSGLDILTAGSLPCARWSTSQTGGTSGHWNVISHVAEGTSAITPTPTSAGVTAHLNGGPYTFLVSCEDGSNNVLATATLTRNIITNAVSYGTGDRNFSNWPSGFGSVAGAKFLFSTGYVSAQAGISFTMNFPQQVIVTWADTSRPGSITAFATGNSTQNVLVKDMSFTGSAVNNNSTTLSLGGNGGGPVSADNVHGYFSSSTTNIANLQFFGGSISGGTLNNYSCDWCGTGMSVPPHYLITNGYFRYFQNNAFFATSVAHDTEIDDVVCASPQGNPAFHQDTFQFADGATPYNLTVKRFITVQADGNNTVQGFYFGGSVLQDATGYVSAVNGDGGGTSGKVLTLVTGSLLSGSNNSLLYSTSGSGVGFGPTDKVALTCAGGNNCTGQTTATLSLASNISLGTAASPVPIYGVINLNNNFDQIAYIGYTINGLNEQGETGTYNYSNFAFVYTQYGTQSPIGGTVGGGIDNCEVAGLHTGTATINGGFFWSGLGFNKHNPIHTTCAGPPANMTVSNEVDGSNNPTTITPLFLNGNPQTVPQGTSFATYAAMTIPQLKAFVCTTLQAAPGQALDGHSPFKTGGGAWQDGTLIPGC